MKAIMQDGYGSADVLEQIEIEKPVITEDEMLIQTYATSVNTIDIFFRSGIKVMFGLSRLASGLRSPKRKIQGFDFAGQVVEIGSNITKFKIGDRVFGGARGGANAEYTRASELSIAKIPGNLSYSDAAAMPVAALSALQGLRDSGEVKEGQIILIYGASGGIGTYAVQLAKNFGLKITAVASGKNEELVRKLGADTFIDYTQEDFTKKSVEYDVIFDTVGKLPISKWKKGLKSGGIFVNAGSPYMSMTRFILARMGNKFRKKQYRSFDTKYLPADLDFLAKLSEEGKLQSIIDKSFTLDEIRKAHRYYENGHTAGKVVVTIRDEVSKSAISSVSNSRIELKLDTP